MTYNIKSFYYNKEQNYMEDEDGNVVVDIWRYISPMRLKIFKEQESLTYIYNPREKTVYEFVYPDESEELDYGW